MDWRKLTQSVAFAKTLSAQERDEYLKLLTIDSPDIGDQVKRIMDRAKAVDGFMMTSVGDFLDDEEPAQAIGEVVDVWKITDVIGSGGMGDVYKAARNDGLYDQTVALKVMRGANETRKAHFKKERQRLAQLNHPGIATILDGGATPDGNPYMAMEYVDGEPIVDYASAKDLSLAQKLGLFRATCRAIAHAHANLVLHRDIKSDNILVDADGRVRLIDFGIATLLDDDDSQETGPFTLATAAPEQLNGEKISVQTDIFALGSLLHQLVAGDLPERQPDGSVALGPSLTGFKDLQAIIARALSTDPQDRYPSADALEVEIDAVLTQRPVDARNGGSLYKISKFVRRAPVAAALGSAFLAALIIGLGATTYYANEATQEAKRANEELARAEWNLKQEFVQFQIAATYSDALQRIYRNEDVDELKGFLLDYVDEFGSESEADPERRALIRFTIGRHFLRRNDYKTVREVMEPWLEAGYGSEDILRFGHAIIGFAYRNTGEPEKAIESFRKSAKFYEGTFSENTADHANVITQAALLSGSEADMDKAATVIKTLLEKEADAQTRMYFQNQIFRIERKRQNWDAAYKTIAGIVAAIDNNQSTQMAGQDTNRMNLAELEVYHRRDMDAALRQVDIVKELAAGDKGESLVLGRALALQAEIDRAQGNFEEAEAHIIEALRLFEKYIGKTGLYISAEALYGMVLADQGRMADAQVTLANLEVLPKSGQWSAFLSLYIAAKEAGSETAQNLIADSGFDADEAKQFLKQIYYKQQLEALGLDFSKP